MEAKLYKTDHFTNKQIQRLRESANRQERKIAAVFYEHPNKAFGPREIHEKHKFNWPITSTRRAFTNLTDADIIAKTDETRKTKYGSSEHKWTWKNLGSPNKQKCFNAKAEMR